MQHALVVMLSLVVTLMLSDGRTACDVLLRLSGVGSFIDALTIYLCYVLNIINRELIKRRVLS